MRRLVAVLATALAGTVAVSATAASRPIDGGTVHDTFDLVQEDFCGVPGLDVTDVGTVRIRYRVTSRGRQQLSYYAENVRESGVVTDLRTGRTVSFTIVTNGKDLHVADNGDGTLTIVGFGTGSYTVRSADGGILGRNPGQFRDSILIDTRGTPDPSDDVFLGQLEVLKASTGRNDDVCAAMLAGLGVEAG
ncbi:MAG TPA: hypothetical protein VNS46_03435 [Nocardioides sp.]|nr:hypothetical protein [Nocardioides sp.]